MTASAATRKFAEQLKIAGVELHVEGDRLRYSAPKGVITEDVLAELKQRKAELIALLREAQPAGAVTAVRREALMPLSFAQQRIWFLDELEPDNPFYNVSLAKRIRGPVDEDRLRQSLLRLIARHEVLRSACVDTDDGPRCRSKRRTPSMQTETGCRSIPCPRAPAKLLCRQPWMKKHGRPFPCDGHHCCAAGCCGWAVTTRC